MAGGGGRDDGGQPPPILVITLSADPRGPTNEWTCHLGPDEGQNFVSGPWGSSITTIQVGGMLADIAMRGYKLQSSLSFGLSSVTGHESDVGTIANGRRSPAEKASMLVRSTSAHNNVIQHIFQREDTGRGQSGLREQEGMQANAAQLTVLNSQVSQLRSDRQAQEEELRSLRTNLERERQEREEAFGVITQALEEKDRELASLRRGVREGAGALAASMAASMAGEEVAREDSRRQAYQQQQQQAGPPQTSEVEPAVMLEEEPEGERLPAEGQLGTQLIDIRSDGTPVTEVEQAEIAQALAPPHAELHVEERRGGSGGAIVESELLVQTEGGIWRDLDQVLAEPVPQNVYFTHVKRNSSYAGGEASSRGGQGGRGAGGAATTLEVVSNLATAKRHVLPSTRSAGGHFRPSGEKSMPQATRQVVQAENSSLHPVFLGRSVRHGRPMECGVSAI
mmetsp:Transcript_68455/g.200241  ORF Transcript_68455/g.200241 Transcript_68455/m.200241 type:complete len:452 (-) Transcript_68455:85-1440(-)